MACCSGVSSKSIARVLAVRVSAMPQRTSPPSRGRREAGRCQQSPKATRREVRAEHRRSRGAALPVANAFRSKSRCCAPALGLELVHLDLLDEEMGAREELDPATLVLLPEPAMVARLTEGNRDEQGAVSPQHALELTERREAGSAVAFHVEPVHGVVGTDVLERGHEQDLVERLV